MKWALQFAGRQKRESLVLAKAGLSPRGGKNIIGGDLEQCGTNPMTGWYRDGFCNADRLDEGAHLVCVEMTEAFLAHQVKIGNDLSTPAPKYGLSVPEGMGFQGLNLETHGVFVQAVGPTLPLPESLHLYVHVQHMRRH